VHLLVIYYQQRRAGARKHEAIARSVGHAGLPIIMTCLTTAGGMASFVVAELASVADLGVYAPVGVLVALVFTLVVLPAAMAVFPMELRGAGAGAGGESLSQRTLVKVGELSGRYAVGIVLVTLGLLGSSCLGMLQLRFSHDPIAWFPEDHPARHANDVINRELGGAMFFESLVDTGRENGLHDPEMLARLDEIRRRASAVRVGDVVVGKTMSLLEVVKETNQALHANRPQYYSIPEDRQLVAQELLLFENSGSDDLEELVDSSFSKARMTFKVSMQDAIEYGPFIRRMDEVFQSVLGDDARYEFTGLLVVFGGMINALLFSLVKTYVLAIAIIAPLLMLLIGRVRIGMVAMIPNLAPIVVTLGIMGWVGIPIDLFTLLIGGIVIGLAVDDTIHFMHGFRRHFEATGDCAASIRNTLRTTGQALLYTSVVLSLGFFIYMLASMENLFNFGFLTGLTIILAFLADVVLAPALMTLVARPARKRATEAEHEPEPMEAAT
jgi:predicted RND superfamily exporter protein